MSAKEYAELRYFACYLEPVGYERLDRNCLLSSPNEINPEMLQFQAGQTENEIANLIESAV